MLLAADAGATAPAATLIMIAATLTGAASFLIFTLTPLGCRRCTQTKTYPAIRLSKRNHLPRCRAFRQTPCTGSKHSGPRSCRPPHPVSTQEVGRFVGRDQPVRRFGRLGIPCRYEDGHLVEKARRPSCYLRELKCTLATRNTVWTALPVTGRVPGAPCI